jgi:hypothetical protein
MKRRSLVKSIIAGSLTAAHPLACLLGRNAYAQTETPPIRTIFVYHPNGCDWDSFFPAAGSRVLPAMTEPLQDVYDNLVFMDGLAITGAVDADQHPYGARKCLTGRYSGAQLGDIDSSIDILMGAEDWANRETNGIIVPSLQLGVGITAELTGGRSAISLNGRQSILPQFNSAVAYQQLFGGGISDPSKLQLLEAARADLGRIRTRLGTDQGQRDRLDFHTEALSALEYKLTNGGASFLEKGCPLPDVSAAEELDLLSNDDTDWSAKPFLPLASDMQQDLTIAALSCGLTRTVTFCYGLPAAEVKVPGSPNSDHSASHTSVATHTLSKRWFMAEIATFIKKLAATPDTKGSLLDNTIVVGISEMGLGRTHSFYRVPMFLASGVNNNVGLVTGRSLDWRNSPARVRRPSTNYSSVTSPQLLISHTDVLDTVRQVAGYTSFEMPQNDGGIMNAWTGGDEPRV